MPVYNRAEYLDEAIGSVLAQTYDHLELIVVDDGSTDESPAIVERWVAREAAAERNRVRLVRQTNAGPSAARNRGVRASTAEYIAFCDSDDIQHPFRIAAQVAAIERTPNAGVVFGEISTYRGGEVVSERMLRNRRLGPTRHDFQTELELAFGPGTRLDAAGIPVPEQYQGCRVYAGWAASLIAQMHLAWACCSMYRRSALEAVGGFDPSLQSYEDWHVSAMVSKRNELVFLDVPLLLYRLHEGQLTNDMEMGVKAHLRVAQEMWRNDSAFYAAHKELVDRVIGSAHWRLATFHAERGDWSKAAEGFFRSVRANPRQKRAYVDLLKAALLARRPRW